MIKKEQVIINFLTKNQGLGFYIHIRDNVAQYFEHEDDFATTLTMLEKQGLIYETEFGSTKYCLNLNTKNVRIQDISPEINENIIREYTKTDKTVLIDLLKLNIPHYFASSEEDDFIEYLDNQIENYFLIKNKDKIVGAGGINYFPDSQTACISWDIVHPAFQGRGIGKMLTKYRIDRIKKDPKFRHIIVNISQLAYKFYEKCGFILKNTEKDYWAKGFDLYHLVLEVR